MADAPVVHIGENSPEKVALTLVEYLARMEGLVLFKPHSSNRDDTGADRKWLLDTYAECLTAVRGYR